MSKLFLLFTLTLFLSGCTLFCYGKYGDGGCCTKGDKTCEDAPPCSLGCNEGNS